MKGFTLVEVLLVLGVIAILGVAAFVIYPRVTASKKAGENIAIMNHASGQIKASFLQGNFFRLNSTTACRMGVMPDKFNRDQACGGNPVLENEWKGRVNVYGSTADGTPAPTQITARHFAILYSDVPSKICTKFTTGTAKQFSYVEINNIVVLDAYTNPADQIDEDVVINECLAAESADILFVSN